MDEYQLEIGSVGSALEKLREDEANPDLIEEYAAEWRNLKAIYAAAKATFEAGLTEARLPQGLVMAGFGEWSLDNVYAFVYDAAMDCELECRELSEIVNSTDYAAALQDVTG